MSAPKPISSREKLPQVIEKFGLVNFENVSIDLIEARKTTKSILDIAYYRSISGIEESLSSELSQKYKVSKEDIGSALNVITYLLKQFFMNEREKLVEKLKKDEKIGDKANNIVELATRIDKKFPDIHERFLLTTYCKSAFYGDIDWEVVFKVNEHPFYHFEKKERFPVATLRLMLEIPASALRLYYAPKLAKKEMVFEASAGDIDKIISTLSTIRDKIEETKREMVPEVGR